LIGRLLKRLADHTTAGTLATTMRRRRFQFFLSLLEPLERPLRILDVGGTQEFWETMNFVVLGEARITLLNLSRERTSGPMFEAIEGDARDLSRFGEGSFDVVFSNSVIEHLGPDFSDQRRMADEIRRVGKRYFVQTPNRYFPIEPHFLTPWFQFWPVGVRVWAVTHFSVGWYDRIPDRSAAKREVESISLLSESQLRDLFPGSRIYKEKIGGLTKSLVAYAGWDEWK
jgi:SAM-dependent methyltransferase